MSQDNILWIIDQIGEAEIDIEALNNEVRNVAEEFGNILEWDNGNDLFKVVKGKLKFHEYGSNFDNYFNVYGHSEMYFLEALSEHILNDVEFLFNMSSEGNPGCNIKVSKFSAKKLDLEDLEDSEELIPKEEQENLLGVYWQMLREIESHTDSKKNALNASLVEGAYNVLNRIGYIEDAKPDWKK